MRSREVDARAEVAAALFAASATQAAAERVADAKLGAQRKEIEEFARQGARRRCAAQGGPHRCGGEVCRRARGSVIEPMPKRSPSFGRRSKILPQTPEGVAALARFNAGDEIGALAVLDDLRAARDAARQKRADIESAAEGRRIATLALEARKEGQADHGPGHRPLRGGHPVGSGGALGLG